MAWCGYCGLDVANPCLEDKQAEMCTDLQGHWTDMVNQPPHYARWKIEPIDFIKDNNLGYLEGNVIKYLMRHDSKNGKEDLEKALYYLKALIEKEYSPPYRSNNE